jgi:polynucleotide 5'-kinase involved in rRNA processing
MLLTDFLDTFTEFNTHKDLASEFKTSQLIAQSTLGCYENPVLNGLAIAHILTLRENKNCAGSGVVRSIKTKDDSISFWVPQSDTEVWLSSTSYGQTLAFALNQPTFMVC